MFLHVVRGDPKFLPAVHDLYEKARPEENHFLCYVKGPAPDGVPSGFKIVRNDSDILAEYRKREDWRGVICSGLLDEVVCLAKVIPPSLPLAWIVWGMEIYNKSFEYHKDLFLPDTKRLSGGFLKNYLRPLIWFARDLRRGRRTILERIDFCVCPFREEFEFIKSRSLSDRIQYLKGWVCARDITHYLSPRPSKGGVDIQVGNSATFENNHTEIFQMLSEMDLDGRNIIVPLSYGDPQCRESVLASGRKFLGDRFHPLLDFMPIDEYNSIIDSCSTVVFNHNRQQGIGNILSAVARGAQVHLRETPIYHGLRRIGLDIRKVSDLKSNDVNQVKESPRLNTRSIFEAEFSLSKRIEDTEAMLAGLRPS